MRSAGKERRWKSRPVVASSEQEITIDEVLLRSLRSRNWRPESIKAEHDFCRYFLKWTDQNDLHLWAEVRYEHIESYMTMLIRAGKARKTIQHYLRPVLRASRWCAANWPREFTDVGFALNFGELPNRDREISGWSVSQVCDFIDWLVRGEHEELAFGVALQGLCGIRLQEVMRIKWTDVDLKAESVKVEQRKQPYESRLLPLPRLVSYILRNHRPKSGDSVVPLYSDYRHYSKAVRRLMVKYGKNDMIPPKDLRNTVPTAAEYGGWHEYAVSMYLGHSPNTTRRRHYVRNTQSQELFDLLRNEVAVKIDRLVEEWQAPEGSLILPYPRLAVGN